MDVLRGAGAAIEQMVMHPINTMAGMGLPAIAGGTMGMYPGTAPMPGKMGEEAAKYQEQMQMQAQQEMAKQGKEMAAHPLYTLGSIAGPTLLTAGIAKIPEMADLFTPYSSPVVPPMETAAERLMQAISPPEGVTPSNVQAAMKEAPSILGYAERTGNPLKTIPEGIKAAQGVAQEGMDYYQNKLLAPNASDTVALPSNVSKELGSSASLGDINSRISDINDLIRGSQRTARSVGQEMTAAERLGLENEANGLRSILYNELSERTGIAPSEIQRLREGYGGQYAIKDALESGHYQRLSNIGRAGQMGTSGVPLTKTDLTGRLMNWLRGGPERIANRQFASRIRAFPATEPTYPEVLPKITKPR